MSVVGPRPLLVDYPQSQGSSYGFLLFIPSFRKDPGIPPQCLQFHFQQTPALLHYPQVEGRWNIKGFLDDNKDALYGRRSDIPVLAKVEDYVIEPGDEFVCCIGDSNNL